MGRTIGLLYEFFNMISEALMNVENLIVAQYSLG